jgi:hypothetical protein
MPRAARVVSSIAISLRSLSLSVHRHPSHYANIGHFVILVSIEAVRLKPTVFYILGLRALRLDKPTLYRSVLRR